MKKIFTLYILYIGMIAAVQAQTVTTAPAGSTFSATGGPLGSAQSTLTITKPTSGCYGWGFQYPLSTNGVYYTTTATNPPGDLGSTQCLGTYATGNRWRSPALSNSNKTVTMVADNYTVNGRVFNNPTLTLTFSVPVVNTGSIIYVPINSGSITVTVDEKATSVGSAYSNPANTAATTWVNQLYNNLNSNNGVPNYFELCSDFNWTYVSMTAPSLSSTTATSPLCPGSTINLSTTGTVGTANAVTGYNGAMTYNWSGPNSYTRASSTTATASVTSITTAAAGAYNVTVTDGFGCTATASTPSVVVRNPVTAIAANSAGTICTDGTTTANSVSVIPAGGTGPYTYQWQYYDGCGATTTFANIASGGTSATYTPPTGSLLCQQFYQVLVTDAGTPGCGTGTSNTVNQAVYPTVAAPTPTTTALVVSSTNNVCNSGNTTLTSTKLTPSVKALDLATASSQYASLTEAGLPAVKFFTGTSFTVESWVYLKSYASWSRLMDFGNGSANENVLIALSNLASGVPWFEVYRGAAGGGLSAGQAIPLSTWTHLACVFSYTSGTTGIATIYINGNQVATGTINQPNNVARANNYIGKSNWPDAYADAKIDEFRIWNTALPQSTIRAWMYKEVGTTGHPNQISLVEALNFDNASTAAVVGTPFTNVNGATYTAPNYFTYTWAGTPGANAGTISPNTTTSETTTVTGIANTTTAAVNVNYTVYAKTPAGCDIAPTPGNVTGSVIVKANPTPAAPTFASTTISGCGQATIYAQYDTINATTCNFYGPGSSTTYISSGTSLNVTVGGVYYVSSYNGSKTCESSKVAVTVTINPTFTLSMTNPNNSAYHGYGVSCYGG